ncbi:hypothetical protein BGX27_000700 [Mortierella sp. AM989]|nr:hypothetical protein BGX27_000700 [Mortierella sp. AM989]
MVGQRVNEEIYSYPLGDVNQLFGEFTKMSDDELAAYEQNAILKTFLNTYTTSKLYLFKFIEQYWRQVKILKITRVSKELAIVQEERQTKLRKLLGMALLLKLEGTIFNQYDVSDHEVAKTEEITTSPSRQLQTQGLERNVHLHSEGEKMGVYSDGKDGDDEDIRLLSHNFQQGPNHTRTGLQQILQVANILALTLIILFCITISNLYTESTWSKVPEETSQPIQGTSSPNSVFTSSNSNPPFPIFDGSNNKDGEHHRHSTGIAKPHNPPRLPPKAKRIPRPLTLYNETLIDNYRWMHQIDHDPDVEAYIHAESEYTTAWVKQSGIEALQSQLEKEIYQIKAAMDNLARNDEDTREGHYIDKPRSLRLEGTRFWDLDRWRYWFDESVGSYGVYMRRPVPNDRNGRAILERGKSYMPQTSDYSKWQQFRFDFPSIQNTVDSKPPKVVGGCSVESSSVSEIQLVLDVNKIAKKHKRKRAPEEFNFGSIEIQPIHTFLDQDTVSPPDGSVDSSNKPKMKSTYAAYTFDTSGDEKYNIRIKTLSPDYQKSDIEQLEDYDMEDEDQVVGFKGAIIKDAGPETRFVRLGRSLYLYFTRLDKKGLSREVWRVKVDSLDDEDASFKHQHNGEATNKSRFFKAHKPKYEPEMILRERDERNILAISETSDKRFMLIESTGQTNSYTFFFSIDYPDKGWNIVRQPEDNVMYKVEHHSGHFYLCTNHGNATNFKVLRFPVDYTTGGLDTSIFSTRSTVEGALFGNAEEDVVIAHDPEEYLERFEVFIEHFVAWIWRGGLQEIRIYLAPRPGDAQAEFPLTEAQRIRPYNKETKVGTLMPGNVRHGEQRLFRDFFSTTLRYSNSSFIHPWALFEYDMHSVSDMPLGRDDDEKQRNATRLICQDPFPIRVKYGEPTRFQQELQEPLSHEHSIKDPKKEQEKEMAKFKEIRIMVPSKYGSKRNRTVQPNGNNNNLEQEIMIPVSIVYYANSESPQFPRQAAFVNAYGAYGTMTSPRYEPESVLPFLYRGLLYVQVHPRGDGVLGPDWYADGKVEHKMNTFYDVEDVLLYLRDSGMVEKGGCVVEGRSAGGLVSGWIANRWGETTTPRPGGKIGDNTENMSENIVREMVKVVLAQVPFMDVIADMSDPDIPWVEYEWAEWGSPLQSREVFEVMKAYSPYDRIRNQRYPAMMVMGGLTDGRVSYAEPLKFVAKLRSIDGKTNDCQPVESQGRNEDEETPVLNDNNDKKGDKRDKMCAGKNDTPLLLQIERGGHFSGKKSLWMAFALYNLGAEKVVMQ